MLVVRAWLEASAGFRARLIHKVDVTSSDETVRPVVTTEDVEDEVRDWLNTFIGMNVGSTKARREAPEEDHAMAPFEVPPFGTMRLPAKRSSVAPDGSDVRVLIATRGGGVAHFQLGPHQTSRAIAHRTVDEIWYVLSGRGEIWRRNHGDAAVEPLEPGVCISIPVGTSFQFRATSDEPLQVLGVTMPPWPGPQEAFAVEGIWTATV